jgi:hypothetical protein
MTTSTTTAGQVDETKARAAAINERVINAAQNSDRAFAERNQNDRFSVVEAIRAALIELATAWREEAAWWENSGRRGAKGTAKELTQAAARLAGVAVGLTSGAAPAAIDAIAISPGPGVIVRHDDGRVEYGEGTQPCPHPEGARSTLRSGAVKCTACGETIKEGDPTMAYLAGETNTYQPAPALPTPPATEIAQAFAATMPNPFTSPGPPRRPAPARLTFDDLGPLIGATYPAPRPSLSHSAIERYAGCGVALLLSDASRAGVLGPERPSWSRVGGQAFHLAIESIERAVLANGGAIAPTDDATMTEFWGESLTTAIANAQAAVGDSPYVDSATWHVANSGREGYDWWRVEGLEMVKRYVTYHDNAWRATHTLLQIGTGPGGGGPYVPVLEYEFRVSAGSTDITDHGFIDAAWVDLSDPKVAKLDIHDYKAGKSRPDDDGQLGGYAAALRRLLPANFALPIRGTYWLARQGVYTPPVTLDAAPTQAKIDYLYKMTKRGIDSGTFVPRVSPYCISCSAIDYCPTRT